MWRWANSDPFGDNKAQAISGFEYNLRFAGQVYDKETGLHYNHFRDYNPKTGRYIQSDPIGLNGGINTYAYVGANPLRFVDPLGLRRGAAAASVVAFCIKDPITCADLGLSGIPPAHAPPPFSGECAEEEPSFWADAANAAAEAAARGRGKSGGPFSGIKPKTPKPTKTAPEGPYKGPEGPYKGPDAAPPEPLEKGKPFTRKTKREAKDKNAAANEGQTTCEHCRVHTVPGQKHTKGVTPPKNETQVDHVIPRAKGGTNDLSNTQILCRTCNIKKGDKL